MGGAKSAHRLIKDWKVGYMAVKKIELTKKVGSNKHSYYPRSSADVIVYDEVLNVKDILDAVIDSVEQVENRLQGRSVYMKDSTGKIVTDDAGTGLVEIL